MKKLIDTNVLLDFPQILDEDSITISIYVLQELDKLKNDINKERAAKAREAIRKIRESIERIDFEQTYLSTKPVDEALLDIAKINNYCLVTNDYNLQIRAKIREINYCDYIPNPTIISDSWKGEIVFSEKEMAKFYETGKISDSFKENQYIYIEDEDGKIVDKYICKNEVLIKVKFKNIESIQGGVLKPRNNEQECSFNMLQDADSKIKVLTGPFGSGKSIIMILQSLMFLEKEKFDKIVYVRNNIELKDTVELGSLPGDEFSKLTPFLMPVADHIGGMFALEKMVIDGKVEPVHLGYLRGRDIKNSIIYVAEAQNLTVDQMQLLIGRVSEGSELWIDGDLKQVDRKIFRENNGLKRLIERLSGNKLFSHVHLIKSERSAVSALADLLD